MHILMKKLYPFLCVFILGMFSGIYVSIPKNVPTDAEIEAEAQTNPPKECLDPNLLDYQKRYCIFQQVPKLCKKYNSTSFQCLMLTGKCSGG